MAERKKFSFHQGSVQFLHDDRISPALAAVFTDAKPEVQRASHVEPDPNASGIAFIADLTPVQGPVLSGFPTRAAAIAAEVKYLNKNFL